VSRCVTHVLSLLEPSNHNGGLSKGTESSAEDDLAWFLHPGNLPCDSVEAACHTTQPFPPLRNLRGCIAQVQGSLHGSLDCSGPCPTLGTVKAGSFKCSTRWAGAVFPGVGHVTSSMQRLPGHGCLSLWWEQQNAITDPFLRMGGPSILLVTTPSPSLAKTSIGGSALNLARTYLPRAGAQVSYQDTQHINSFLLIAQSASRHHCSEPRLCLGCPNYPDVFGPP
jgi:hypothetical protein